VDTNQFDRLTIAVSRHVSRRSALKGLGAALTSVVAAALGRHEAQAAPYTVALGGSCYRDLQCRNDFIPTRRRQQPLLQTVHCADNGFTYDGPFNCCRNTGGTCYADEDCCGTRSCVRQFCRYIRGKRQRRRHDRRHPHPRRHHRTGK
jgi:hypothetical protein